MKNTILPLVILSLCICFEARCQNFGWAKQIGGTMSEYCNAVSIDSYGNIYSIGTFVGQADFNPGLGTFYMTTEAGSPETFILKLDSSGNFIWAKQLGKSSIVRYNSMAIDAIGNICTTGNLDGWADFDPGPETFLLGGGSQGCFFVSKLDASGNFVWAKRIGGAYGETGATISADPMGNVYTIGLFSSTVDFNPDSLGEYYMTSVGGGSFNTYILKLDASGNFVWAKQLNGVTLEGSFSLTHDKEGNFYLTGYFGGTPDFDPNAGVFMMVSDGSLDIFILKLNASGNFVWAKRLGGNDYEKGQSIMVDDFKNVYTTGYFNATVDFDPGPNSFYLTPLGMGGYYVSKLDSLGKFVWAKNMGRNVTLIGKPVSVDVAGNVYVAGWFTGTTNLYPGAGSFGLTSAGSEDIFISKLSAAGELGWVKQIGSSGKDRAYSINSDMSGNVFAAGYFNGTVDFDPGEAAFNLVSNGFSDVFILKLTNTTTAVTESIESINFRIFPNPGESEIFIELANDSKGIAEIYNLEGHLKLQVTLQPRKTSLQVNHLPNGIYFVKAYTKDGTFTKKFVKSK